MTTYIWDKTAGVFVTYDRLTEKAARCSKPRGLMLHRDLPAYKSPLGDGWIDGRTERREHFKRTGTREVDPSEYRPVYHSEARAKANGGVFEERPAIELPATGEFQRGWKE